jgi:hypothetical protein
MWTQAKIMIAMLNSTVMSLEMIGGLAKRTDYPREALGTISAIVMSCVEGFQGRTTARDIEGALLMLKAKLADQGGMPSMNLVEEFKAAL